MPDLLTLGRLAEAEFFEIVQSTAIVENKLRVALIDGSFIDFRWSEEISGRFAYHWERTLVDGTSTATTTYPTCDGAEWPPSPSITTMARSKMSPRAPYRKTRSRDPGSSSNSPPE